MRSLVLMKMPGEEGVFPTGHAVGYWGKEPPEGWVEFPHGEEFDGWPEEIVELYRKAGHLRFPDLRPIVEFPEL